MPLCDRDLPPCIVLGLETQIGLSIVRELGRAGVPIIGIAHEPNAIGLASRYLWKKLIVKRPRSEELIRAIFTLGEEHGACCLIAVSEANLGWLARHRDALGKVRAVVPNIEKLSLVLDKQQTLRAAQEVGITVPQSLVPTSMTQCETLANTLNFPRVLKWKDPNAIASKLGTHGLTFLKAEYVYTSEQFLTATKRYAPLGEWPIVQSYCPGRGLGQFFYMHQGEAIRRFQHLRIAEWPPEGGFSSVCDSVPLDQHLALQELSIALLRRIGWEGVAMVEYRWDPMTDRAVLMEINGRYWGSYPLAMHSHAEFAWISYCIESGLTPPKMTEPRQSVRCRMLSTEIKRLVRILIHSNMINDKNFKVRRFKELSRFILDFFKTNTTYYVWDRTDPKPFFQDVKNMICKKLNFK